MAKIVRLTESDLARLVRKVINEQRYLKHDKLNRWTSDDDYLRNFDTLPGEDSDYDEEEFDDYDTFSQKYPDSKPHSRGWSGQDPKDVFNMYKDTYGPLKVKTRRSMTESDLRRIAGKVIMESESPSYHLFVERLDEIQEEMKYKNMTDEELDDIRESLEEEKSDVKNSDDNLTEIEKKRLNKRINSLLTKLKGMYNPHSYEPMRVKPRTSLD